MVLLLTWNFMCRLPFYYTKILRLYGFSLWFLLTLAITFAVKGIVYKANGYILDTAIITLLSKIWAYRFWYLTKWLVGIMAGKFGLICIDRKLRRVFSADIKTLTNRYDIIKHFHGLMDLVQNDKRRILRISNPTEEDDVLIAGSIAHHFQKCTDASCICRSYDSIQTDQSSLIQWQGIPCHCKNLILIFWFIWIQAKLTKTINF